MPYALIAVAAVVVILILWFISSQRRLVVLDENINNAMSQIGVQLNSRFDALTALLDLTHSYAEHESETLMATVKARRTTITGKSNAKDVEAQESILADALGRINAVAEAYPDLKANENYIKTMDSVNSYENTVRQSRLIYNDCVTKMNRAVRMFPGSVAAGLMHFGIRDYLETKDEKAEMPNMKG